MNRAGIVLIIVAFLLFPSCNAYIVRYFAHNKPGQEDAERLPSKAVANSDSPFFFSSKANENFEKIECEFNNITYSGSLDSFLVNNQTTAFVVIKDDTVIYENYFNGNFRSNLNHSFSVSKSILSALVGIAIDKGYIKSKDDYIVSYISELDKNVYGDIKIKDLLNMNSGITTGSSYLPWGDEARAYYGRNIRKITFKTSDKTFNPGEKFFYTHSNVFFAAMILERASGMSVTEFTEKYLWAEIGTEFPASWTIDSKKYGFEKVESGLNAAAIDFAKVGRLFLNSGKFGNKQIIPEQWINITTAVNNDFISTPGYLPPYMRDHNICYAYSWRIRYNDKDDTSAKCFYAQGYEGQYLWLNPKEKVIIVRFGNSYAGSRLDWLNLFNELTRLAYL